MKMSSRLAAAAVMGGLFLAGGVTGGSLVSVLDGNGARFERDADDARDAGRRRGGRDRDGPREPRLTTERVVKGLARRLDLTEEQRDTVEAILEAQGREARRMFREMAPALRTLMDSTNVEIRALLTPAQQAEFDTLLAEDRNLLRRRYDPPDSVRDPGESR